MNAWGSIIIHGVKSYPTPAHLVYIDCNASFGRYPGESTDKIKEQASTPVFGSPIIGIQALDTLVNWASERYGKKVRTNAILIEKDPKVALEYEWNEKQR